MQNKNEICKSFNFDNIGGDNPVQIYNSEDLKNYKIINNVDDIDSINPNDIIILDFNP